eukprot:3716763-Ditylum_brightwellii.AAC.1
MVWYHPDGIANILSLSDVQKDHRQDVMAAEDIFGPDTRCLQGKTVRKDGKAVRMIITSILLAILDRYKE